MYDPRIGVGSIMLKAWDENIFYLYGDDGRSGTLEIARIEGAEKAIKILAKLSVILEDDWYFMSEIKKKISEIEVD
jgi:hypothetical protein